MRAVVQKSFGGPEVLETVDIARPEPLGGEVLIRVMASGVNPVDVAVRSGAYPLLGEPPFGVGWDISGVVEEAGPGARFKVGDEVFGMPFFPVPRQGTPSTSPHPRGRSLVSPPRSATWRPPLCRWPR
ncbi:alcohol dehydrogenase catalytic domain-containing protein [Nonomuraea recticatena]|uniref:alcohol dehydrogenase catalytic domain-containing protein n=1 Tax=Nonomuraea recticatena TaxID=46178 RepID=UPI003609CAF1